MNTIKLNTIGTPCKAGGNSGGGGGNTIFDCSNPEDIEKLFHRLDALLMARGENADISDCGIIVLKPLKYSSALVGVVTRRNDQSYGIAIEFQCYDASSFSEEPYGMSYGAQCYNGEEWRIYNASLG